MHRPIMLISTPRSGSDWFAEACLLWKMPEYFREYFNPICNFHHCAVLRQAFGSEVDWPNIAVPWECQEITGEYVHEITWRREPYQFTKENYAAFKIGLFHRHFECFSLVGHRSLTFPGGSRPRSTEYWWERIFQSLEFNRHLLDDEVGCLIDHATAGRQEQNRRMVAAQVIMTYQTVRECLRYQIPIMEYRRLIALDSTSEMVTYLADKVPAALLDLSLAERVVGSKRVVDKSGRYLAWNVEGFASELIDLIPTELQSFF